ncbi:hypothetical protein GU243_02995 [Pseudarthrobacter psychrotolerans]|uniref:Uncharacterized protein n=1 Tax=Pseudarthrobacter psychrotolerans TaxID=2697569 RepID=A0A6P1NK89_9MICC|nr:hypothetical protein [Pseudarthrobacter psychrotolerans]QHK18904.1 hypothetical protein GU243_02995 [Pseudarthrobacter psychrotolerans]
MTSPIEFEKRIRFGLNTLAETNSHHDFEAMSLGLAENELREILCLRLVQSALEAIREEMPKASGLTIASKRVTELLSKEKYTRRLA